MSDPTPSDPTTSEPAPTGPVPTDRVPSAAPPTGDRVVGPVTDAAASPGRSTADRVARGLVAVAELLVVVGAVVGFNQLATQSPVDAVLPVALFSVGVAGLVSFVAGLFATRARTRPGPPLRGGVLEPPALDGAFTAFGLGLVAVVAVLGHWGVAALAALVGVQGLRLLLQTEEGVVSLVRRDACDPEPLRLGLTAAEAVVLLVFAVAALADAGIAPFG